MRCLMLAALVAFAAALPALPVNGQPDDQASAGNPASPAAIAARAPDGLLPLEGTPWRLRAYLHRDQERIPGPEVAARLRLQGGRVEASGGCTAFGGRYGRTGQAIRFALRGIERGTCAEQTMLVERSMIAGLRQAVEYRLLAGSSPEAAMLALYDAAGRELLRLGLDDVASLEGSEWQLESYAVDGVSTKADPGQRAVLAFGPQREAGGRPAGSGRLTGSTGCNGFIAEYTRQGNVMSLGPIDVTDAPCAGGLAAQQEGMLAVLGASAQLLALPPDRLLLTSAEDGSRLELVSGRPLEGTTWLLSRLRGGLRPGQAVTLRLSEGVASGEGPCGPYRASYVTDGLFITFGQLEAGSPDDCTEPALERGLADALARAVGLERAASSLRLLDARGSVLARFRAPAAP